MLYPKAEAMLDNKKTEFFTEYPEKGVPATKVPNEFLEPLVKMIMSASDEKIMNI